MNQKNQEATPRNAADISCARLRSERESQMLASTTPTLTTATVKVATVLTLGLRPRRARLKMVMGMVVDPGPDRKADSTTSSSDRVKVSNQAEAMA